MYLGALGPRDSMDLWQVRGYSVLKAALEQAAQTITAVGPAKSV